MYGYGYGGVSHGGGFEQLAPPDYMPPPPPPVLPNPYGPNPFFAPEAIQYVSRSGRRPGYMVNPVYRIGHHEQEFQCRCGWPCYVGDTAFEEPHTHDVYCAPDCPARPAPAASNPCYGLHWHQGSPFDVPPGLHPAPPMPPPMPMEQNPFFAPEALQYVTRGAARAGMMMNPTLFGADRQLDLLPTPFKNPPNLHTYLVKDESGQLVAQEVAKNAKEARAQAAAKLQRKASGLKAKRKTKADVDREAGLLFGHDPDVWLEQEARQRTTGQAELFGENPRQKAKPRRNPYACNNPQMTPKGRAFVSKEVRRHMRKGWPQRRAVVEAMNAARRKGYKAPPPPKKKAAKKAPKKNKNRKPKSKKGRKR